ncbi:UNVERIFIED_CONTAM: hypothetical protein NCL1_25383 [Trichonephila clavipes]
MKVDHERLWKILWSDEAHFYLTGYVNIQNFRIRATGYFLNMDNLSHIWATTFNSTKTTSFCKGPYFFEETGAVGPFTVSVFGQRFECHPCNYVILDVQLRGCVERIIFVQNGAPPHIANPVNQLLKETF